MADVAFNPGAHRRRETTSATLVDIIKAEDTLFLLQIMYCIKRLDNLKKVLLQRTALGSHGSTGMGKQFSISI